jgi:predicted enzyme related to lactoylglutathione lyase
MPVTASTPRKNARRTTNGFWWADLASTDDAAAADFYSRIFGWEYDEMPIGDGLVHRNAKLGGMLVAGIDPVMPGTGQPTSWTNFVFVEDIDATVATARELGAKVIAEPMDVMGEGHMAVLMDPTGAAVGLWQPGRHTGADAVNQPGTYTWVELATSDLDTARDFYSKLFGWTWTRMDRDFEYWLAELDGRSFAGAYPKLEQMADMPSHWAPYFGVADIEATAQEIRAAGGTILVGPSQMGPGTGVAVMDPQGGAFYAIQMDEWPTD